MIAPPLAVVKVGGSLLGDAADLKLIAEAVARRRLRGERLLVVVSALRGVTDLLDEAARNALDPRSGGEIVRDVMDRLYRRHRRILDDLPGGDAVWLRIRPVLDGAERLLTGIRLTGELSERSRDLLLAHGERFSAPIVAAAVTAAGADARAVTAEEAGLRARGPFHVGSADLAASAEGLAGLAHELHDRVLVLTGFYGIDVDGNVVLFGRGGTDYTAGVAAAGLGADAMELWKDVPGFMSADPTAVSSARRVEELSFDEACELGYYGARILHPRCLDPLRGTGMDVSVRSIHDVDSPGTRLVERCERQRDTVAALAARSGVAVVRVQGAAMVNQPGVAGAVLAALGEAGVNVDAVATSMTSLSCTVDASDAPLARRTLKLLKEHGATGVERIHVETGAALLGVVGDGLAGDAAMPARMLSCLASLGVPVALISHGPGDVGLSCAVPEAHLERALVALHAAFFDETPDAGAPSPGQAARGRHTAG